MNIETIATWKGQPLVDMDPLELIVAMSELGRENQRLREENLRLSIQSVRDAATIGRARANPVSRFVRSFRA